MLCLEIRGDSAGWEMEGRSLRWGTPVKQVDTNFQCAAAHEHAAARRLHIGIAHRHARREILYIWRQAGPEINHRVCRGNHGEEISLDPSDALLVLVHVLHCTGEILLVPPLFPHSASRASIRRHLSDELPCPKRHQSAFRRTLGTELRKHWVGGEEDWRRGEDKIRLEGWPLPYPLLSTSGTAAYMVATVARGANVMARAALLPTDSSSMPRPTSPRLPVLATGRTAADEGLSKPFGIKRGDPICRNGTKHGAMIGIAKQRRRWRYARGATIF
jgi:hypothetical protein